MKTAIVWITIIFSIILTIIYADCCQAKRIPESWTILVPPFQLVSAMIFGVLTIQ